MLKKYIMVCLLTSVSFTTVALASSPTMDKHVALALAAKENTIRCFNEMPDDTKKLFQNHHEFITSIVQKCIDASAKLKEGKEHAGLLKKANFYLRIWESRLKNLKHAVVDIKADEAKVALLSIEGVVGDDKIFADALLEIIKLNLNEIKSTTDSMLRGSLIHQLQIDIKQLEIFLKKKSHTQSNATKPVAQSTDQKTVPPQAAEGVVK